MQKNSGKRCHEIYCQLSLLSKVVPRFTKQLIISDSSYKLVHQNDISNDAFILFYPYSATKDLNNIIDNYVPLTKAECLIIQTGHNSIDQGNSGEDAAKE